MAFQSHRTRFKGDLAGIEQEKIIELDYTKEKVKERMEYIKMKYSYVRKYHEKYTSEYYKVNVNTNDNLSSDINIFKAIEKDANYLLNSLDLPREGEYKYNLLTQEEFDKKIKTENKADLYGEGLVDVLRPELKNDYVNMDLKIEAKDLREATELGRILREYEVVRIHLKKEMNNIKDGEGSYLKLYQIKNNLGSMKGDMLDCKKSYKGITRPSTKLGDESGKFYLEHIDYTNPDVVKAIITTIRFGEIQPDSILSHLAYDIEVVVKRLYEKGSIDSLDLEIIDCINSGMNNVRTAKEVNRDESTVRTRVNKICKKIAEGCTYIKIV